VFRVNHPGALWGDGMTQFGRALHALNIDIICANSIQAKGRVERAHKTLHDRLVKELRLAGVRSLAEGNALLVSRIRHSFKKSRHVWPEYLSNIARSSGGWHRLSWSR
jgi:hypothetical protein